MVRVGSEEIHHVDVLGDEPPRQRERLSGVMAPGKEQEMRSER